MMVGDSSSKNVCSPEIRFEAFQQKIDATCFFEFLKQVASIFKGENAKRFKYLLRFGLLVVILKSHKRIDFS